jgi:hypothetical protein
MEKKCKYCAMMIPKEAKVCPHCRKKQGLSRSSKIVILVILLGVLGYYVHNLASESVYEAPEQADNKPLGKPVIIMTAKELVTAYKDNEVTADTAYRGKVIGVYGLITDIKKDAYDKPYVVLSYLTISYLGDTPRPSMEDVCCRFNGGSEASFSNIHRGQPATIVGICTGKVLSSVVLTKCIVSEG